MEKRVEVAIARTMCRQQSQITKEQAIARGMTEAEIRTRHESGVWVIVAGGLYRSAEASVTWTQRAHAACLIAGPGPRRSRSSQCQSAPLPRGVDTRAVGGESERDAGHAVAPRSRRSARRTSVHNP